MIYGSVTLVLLQVNSLPACFDWQGFYVVSRLSYGVYLNHFEVLPRVIPRLQRYVGAGTGSMVFCWFAALAVSLLLAFVTFAAIELPFLRLRDRWLAKR